MEHLDKKETNSEDFEDLHNAIGKGDLETVKRIVESHGEEQFFSFDETSALYKAFLCKNYDIISFLIHKGAKFVGSEERYVYSFEVDMDRLNYLLLQYNKKSEKSCIYRLIAFSQSPQVLDGERLNAIMSMYEHFLKSDVIKMLMKILESDSFDIVYDFQSEKVNRIHRLYEEEAEIFGLTLTNSKEIFVGAKNLLSEDHRKRSKVYGVVAEELCHLAMTNVFKNNAKPYREGDSKLIEEFHDIVLAVRSFIVRSCHVESVIQDVFEYYGRNSWECELIARIPHIIGIYGEELGRKILQESSELCRLLEFYEQNVQPKCKLYSDPSINTKSHREMEEVVTKDFISYKEKQIHPLNKNFQSFRKYLVEWESISIITTNCARLCMLHMYHELKKEYGFLLDKKCLFFSRKCFEKNIYKIRDIMKGNLWEYLILMMDKRELNLSRFQAEYIDHLEDFIMKGMNLIMILSTPSTDEEFDFEKALNYKWSDLSEEYKHVLQGIKYLFKGEEEVTYIGKEYFPKVFNDDDISVIISGELIEVNDGNDLFSQGYLPETYIMREFHSTVVDEEIFKHLSTDTNIFLSGLKREEVVNLPLNKDLVQWFQGSDDEIQSNKSIFIIDDVKPKTVQGLKIKISGENYIWLDYDEKEFHVRSFNFADDVFSCHIKPMTLSEKEILKFLKRKKSLIISDNAGYGKSTIMSSLIDNVRRNVCQSWNWRVNFSKFAGNKTDPLSIANVEEKSDDEEVLDHFFLILGLKNCLERHLFWEFSKGGHCFIFFDGFDEIPSELVSNALKLLCTVRGKTLANIIVSTRKHHQKELEQLFDNYSHQLVPLSRRDQVRYLEKLWKCKFKYPYGKAAGIFHKNKRKVPEKIRKIIEDSKTRISELDQEFKDLISALEGIDLRDCLDSLRLKIDDLELSRLAESVIDRTSLNRDLLEFMGIPLHVFIIGIIYFDSNFNAEIDFDIYGIYSKFIDQKIVIFVEEKQGWVCAGPLKERTLKNERKNAYRIHIELASQLIFGGKIDRDMKEEDLELCSALGIVFINGAEIDFLHFTFAEFFKAESFRLNMGSGSIVKSTSVSLAIMYVGPFLGELTRNKCALFNMLFDNKYNVVRRFLSSALEKEKFENVTEEFFGDVDFLVFILVQFVHKCYSFYYSFYNDKFNLASVVKILKCLSDTFEKNVNKDLMSVFVCKLKLELLSLQGWFFIGGCLTVGMLKMLLNQSVDMQIIFAMVEYNSDPKEVTDVLSECISIMTAGECNGNEGRNENIKGQGLLQLLQIRGSIRFGLLHHAVWNARAGIFANILKFSKDVLGEEQFINSIILSEEYRLAMIEFIIFADFDRIRGLLKELHSIFGDEFEALFDLNLKFGILEKTLLIKDKSNNTFEEAICLFTEYFGNEKLKQVFQICNSDGKYLTHSLATQNRNVIKNLNVISNVFNDEIEMKHLLKTEDRQSKNIFHFVAENQSINIGDVLQFCYAYLKKEEINEMLISVDNLGVDVLHLLFLHGSLETLIESVNLIKDALDVDCFKKSVMSKDKKLMNIFHFAALNAIEIKMSFLNLYLDESEIKKLLIERDVMGNTCLHCGANSHSVNLPFLIDYMYGMLRFDNFEELILAKNFNGYTFLHLLAENYCVNSKNDFDFVNLIIKSLRDKLSVDLFKTMLRLRNKEGKIFLQMENAFNKQTIECFKIVLEKKLCEELLPTNENA